MITPRFQRIIDAGRFAIEAQHYAARLLSFPDATEALSWAANLPATTKKMANITARIWPLTNAISAAKTLRPEMRRYSR